MKLSNEYFDIRHNDYLNGAKQQREALNDSQFVEYLYNRAYALLYLLRLKQCNQDGQECEVIGIYEFIKCEVCGCVTRIRLQVGLA